MSPAYLPLEVFILSSAVNLATPFISSSLLFEGPVRLAKHSPGRTIKSRRRLSQWLIVASSLRKHLSVCVHL